MKLTHINIRNYRMLRRFSINLNDSDPTTILVGANNSGKTSVMDALRLFIGRPNEGKNHLSIHDISQKHRRTIACIGKYITPDADEERLVERLKKRMPRIRIDLIFEYNEVSDDLVIASQLLCSLSPDSNRVALRGEFSIDKPQKLIRDYKSRRRKEDSLFDFLNDNINAYYSIYYYKRDPESAYVSQIEGNNVVSRLIRVDMISAQRHMDDQETSRATRLSQLLHDHYNRYYKHEDPPAHNDIEEAVRESAACLTEKYEGVFERLTTRLSEFGYASGHTTPDLRIRAEMDADTVYRNNTHVYYARQRSTTLHNETETIELPERYNGLGFKNLIYIVLQLESFRASVEAMVDAKPCVHIIAIEEPEAHLHPQMQCVFVREISKVLHNNHGPTAQVVLSTHSSHMVADSGFEPIRYFKRQGDEVAVRDLSQLLEHDGNTLRFLKRYMRLTHCDLFFADKAILVEGQVERLLLPEIIDRYKSDDEISSLRHEYVSVTEIGGAYAHKLQPLIDFIEIPTLIITDIDAADDSGTRVPVAEGVTTTNQTLRRWLPAKPALEDLLSAEEHARTRKTAHVTYQFPETDTPCGRSFEEAFIYANHKWLSANYNELDASAGTLQNGVSGDLIAKAYDVASRLTKVDFAIDLATADGWQAPQYILDGLRWLGRQEVA